MIGIDGPLLLDYKVLTSIRSFLGRERDLDLRLSSLSLVQSLLEVAVKNPKGYRQVRQSQSRNWEKLSNCFSMILSCMVLTLSFAQHGINTLERSNLSWNLCIKVNYVIG